MTAYIALLRKDSDSDYGVDFPDFPGCITAGRTLDEARRLASEALALHVRGMMEDRETLPEPSELGNIMADPDNQKAVGFLVDIPIKPVRSIRVNVMLPDDLLKQIDQVSRNRSQFLADAARERLAHR
jgi:predicted RNase H-like HicB family nuclease